MITALGVYTIPESQYHADPAPEPSLSSSIAHILLQQSPLHAKAAHPRLTPGVVSGEAKHFDLGKLCHALLLEGIDKAHVIQATRKEGTGKNRIDTGGPVTDYRTNEAKQERDEARAAGKCPILAHELADVTAMMKACREQLDAHSEASNAFSRGTPEQTLVWQEANGIWCRARLDWLHLIDAIVDDFKSTGISANPDMISRTMWTNGWPIQAAFYTRGFKAVFGQNLEPLFRFVVQEAYAPFALSVISLDPSAQAFADAKVAKAIRIWGECLTSGIWPGYPDRIAYAEVPAWMDKEGI